jgi:hypothetical protein
MVTRERIRQHPKCFYERCLVTCRKETLTHTHTQRERERERERETNTLTHKHTHTQIRARRMGLPIFLFGRLYFVISVTMFVCLFIRLCFYLSIFLYFPFSIRRKFLAV